VLPRAASARACGLPSQTLAPRRGVRPASWRVGDGARGAGRQGIAGRGLTGGVGPNGGRRSPKHGRGARRRPHVIEVSPVGGLGFGVAPPGRGTRQLTAAIGGEGRAPTGPPGGSGRAGHARRGPGGRAASVGGRAVRTTIVGNIYMYHPPARCTRDIYPGRVGWAHHGFAS
jgi:hypothetical protein